jgi:hypothetical protein
MESYSIRDLYTEHTVSHPSSAGIKAAGAILTSDSLAAAHLTKAGLAHRLRSRSLAIIINRTGPLYLPDFLL